MIRWTAQLLEVCRKRLAVLTSLSFEETSEWDTASHLLSVICGWIGNGNPRKLGDIKGGLR